MLQSLLDQNLLLPYLGIAAAVMAVFAIRIGWSLQAFFARRRETALRGELRDARTSAPALASNLRMREETIRQLQDDNRDLRAGFTGVEREKTELERKLQALNTRVRGLTEELAALRGSSSSFDIEGMGEAPVPVSPVDEDAEALRGRLQRIEASYGKLQNALNDKTNRIATLEQRLEAVESGTDRPTRVQYDALTEKLRRAEATVVEQAASIAQLEEQKTTLENLAERRSRTNHVVREAEREAQTKNRRLEEELDTATKTLAARDASIHRLFQELRDTQDALRDAREDIAGLRATLETRDASLADLRETLARLEAERQAAITRSRESLNAPLASGKTAGTDRISPPEQS